MSTISVSEARSNLLNLVDAVATSHDPILIIGERNNVVLLSEEDWRAINETLFLLGVPGMRESLHEGMNTPVDECDDDLDPYE